MYLYVLRILCVFDCRVFKLVLRPDHSLFAEDVVFEGENGRTIDFDPGKAYVGNLEGTYDE